MLAQRLFRPEAELDAAKVVGPIAGRTEITLTLPAGWRVQLPPAVEVTGKWGHYAAHYTQEDQTLPVVREVEGARGVYAQGPYGTWLRGFEPWGQTTLPIP